MAKSSAFDVLYRVSDLPPLIFGWLDPSSLALAACVCRAWRDLARKARGESKNLFQLVFVDLLAAAPTLAWAVENLAELSSDLCDCACYRAAGGGYLEVLQWARGRGYRWDWRTCVNAAQAGHLDVLRWARANGCKWDSWTCAYAARYGHLAVLQWARANGCKWDSWTCAYAAEGGHLDVLKWARERGCEWDAQTCTNAAFRGHLAVLQWARANGCPWDKEDCLIQATDKGHKAVVAWILAQPE